MSSINWGSLNPVGISSVSKATGISALVAGSVVFADANGHLGQDNANFFWNNTTKTLIFGPTVGVSWNSDLFLFRDAANILALRNGTNPQTLRIYLTTGQFLAISQNAIGPIFDSNNGGAFNFEFAEVNTFLIASTGIIPAVDNTLGVGAAGNRFATANIVALTLYNPTLLTTGVALTNNAGAQSATITNGPLAGNPTKWIPINDNGTVRNIPAW